MSESGGAAQAAGGHRIGDAERAAATEALDAHREAGRLDAVEFEDRQVAVSRARTWQEIQPLFRDLPAPHPAGMPPESPRGLAAVPGAGATVAVPAGQAVAEQYGPLGRIVPHRYRDTVMALTPFGALALAFTTQRWEFFLGIPVMAILLYGAEGHKEREHQKKLRRQRERNERKLQERLAKIERRRLARELRRNRHP